MIIIILCDTILTVYFFVISESYKTATLFVCFGWHNYEDTQEIKNYT